MRSSREATFEISGTEPAAITALLLRRRRAASGSSLRDVASRLGQSSRQPHSHGLPYRWQARTQSFPPVIARRQIFSYRCEKNCQNGSEFHTVCSKLRKRTSFFLTRATESAKTATFFPRTARDFALVVVVTPRRREMSHSLPDRHSGHAIPDHRSNCLTTGVG